jgi:membrane protease YdiL (CAAX protease family)
MKNNINQTIKRRRCTLCMMLFMTLLFYNLISVPILFLYPQNSSETVPRTVLFLYNQMQEKRELINLYIDKNPVLSLLTHSELVKSILFILIQCFLFIIPLFFYKKPVILNYLLRMKKTGRLGARGIFLFAAVLFSMIIYVIICSAYITPQNFPPFNLKYMIFWIRYIFILCFFAPFCEEFLFRGIVLDEIKYCYNISPRLLIFCQAFIFFVFHFLLASNLSLVTLLLGIATGIIAFYTNSLLYNLLYHIFYNFFVLLIQTGIINLSAAKISYFFLIPTTFLFFFLHIFLILFFIRYMKTRPIFIEEPLYSYHY